MGWEFILLFLIAWFLQNCIHEGSHIYFARKAGFKITGFYPYPHFHKGRFYFARSAWKGKRLEPRSEIMLGPMYGVTLVIPLIAFSTFIINRWYAFPFYLCAVIDALWWIRGYYFGSKWSDAKRYRYGDPK